MEVADDASQIKKALAAQARLEADGTSASCDELVAFQSLLQAQAPWDVYVPFAPRLAEEIGKTATATRILRDYARLLSFVKAIAILRHQHRQVIDGRLVAELEDYQTVVTLIGDMYESTVGASDKTREAVKAVSDLISKGEKVNQAQVGKALGIAKASASRRINTAIAQGWLVNQETRKNQPMDLKLGDELPAKAGLPAVELLHDSGVHTSVIAGTVERLPETPILAPNLDCSTVPPDLEQDGTVEHLKAAMRSTVPWRSNGSGTLGHPKSPILAPNSEDRSTVSPNTDDDTPNGWREEF